MLFAGSDAMDSALKYPQRAGIYCRLSYAPDGSLEKVERQEQDCRELAERLRWPISELHVFPDNSRSAWQRNRRRPQWDRMLQAIDEGEIDAIIVYHGDRLIRQPWDLELLLNIAREKGIRLASPSGTRNLDSPDDQFILRIEAAQACRESDNISRRQKRGHKARSIKGRGTQGGKRPFGFGVPTGRVKRRIDPATGSEAEVEILDYDQQRPDEAGQIKEVANRILAGLSIAGAVRYMNEVSTTTQGGEWTSRVVRSLLTSPRVAGLVENEGVLYEAVWKPIISEDTRQGLIALFEHNREVRPNPGPRRVHLLSGGAECGPCGGGTIHTKTMGGRRRNTLPTYGSYRVYYCKDCRRVARNVALLDGYVEGKTLRLLQTRRFSDELDAAMTRGRPDLAGQITALRLRKGKLEGDIRNAADHPDLDPVLAMASVASYKRRIDELRGRLATTQGERLLESVKGIGREEWSALDVDVRAAVVSLLWRVVILPTGRRGPGFDPSSVLLRRRPLMTPAEDGPEEPG